jgi:hypothetical protein
MRAILETAAEAAALALLIGGIYAWAVIGWALSQ